MAKVKQPGRPGSIARFAKVVSLALLIACGGAAASGQQVWDAAADFSSSSDPDGAWSYGWEATHDGSFSLFDSTTQTDTVYVWLQSNISAISCGCNEGDSTVYSATWACPPHTMLMHPGPSDENSTLRWTAPTDGTYRIDAYFFGIDYVYPTSTDVAVEQNSVDLFHDQVTQYGTGPTFSTTVSAKAGDVIDFAVGYGNDGSYYGDATGVVATITEVDASWDNYGQGFPGTLGVPSFTASANPVLGTTIDLDLADSSTNSTIALVIIGLSQEDLPFPNSGTLLVNPLLIEPLSLPTSGLSLPASLPDDDGLIGLHVDLQALEADPGAQKGISFTQGLELVLGR